MTDLAIDSRVYGANVRSSAGFGENIVGYLHQADPVQSTGPQVGDRWIPCEAEINGTTKDVFISKNVLRPRVSDKKEALIREAVKQWVRFDRETGKEDVHPYYTYVGEYWTNIGKNLDGRNSNPWSAAFISWCIAKTEAYNDFTQDGLHAVYVNEAIKRREAGTAASFWGLRITEHKPAIGDIVCMARGTSNTTYEDAKIRNDYFSHCDIVISIRDDHISTLGGNVGNTVKRKTFRLNSSGYLRDEKRLYAIMRNNL